MTRTGGTRPIVSLAFALMVLVGGCAGDPDSGKSPGAQAPGAPAAEAPRGVPTKSTEEMIKPTESYVAEIIRWIDPPAPPKGSSTETPPCGDSSKENHRTSVFRAYNVALESPKHQAAFERVRDGMIARGFKITSYDAGSDRSSPGGTSGKMRASDPQSGYGMQLSSTSPPTEITIWVGSPCFVPAPTTTPSAS